MDVIRRFLRRLLSFFRSGHAEADLAREIRSHLQLLEDKFLAQGMSAEDARCAARRAFGGVEQVKEHQRDERSFRWLDNSWLDFKLGARMLIKNPGLALVGGLGMAVAIAIAAGAFVVIDTLLDPALPLDDGDRVVAIQNWDAAANNPERRVLHDYVTWRNELKSVVDVGAYRQVGRNLIAPGAQPETVHVAEMTASGFRVARVSPLLGRHFVEEDDREGAAPVVVIGYDMWRSRFAGDPGLLGRTIQLGDTTHSVVGVMPEGFAFPVSHTIWVPLRLDPSRYERRKGPAITVFARLAPGVTLQRAQSELTTIGQRTAAAFPKTHAQLRPQVWPYTYPLSDMDDPENTLALHLMQFLVTVLLVVVCVNVAILVYARTATRQGEIAVRSALGASRRRIVAQLFVEAVVLSATAAAVGLALVTLALRQMDGALLQVIGRLPFWMHFRLSSDAVVYVLLLTILAAAIVGIVPALKATGRRVQIGLQSLSAGGGSGMRLGRTWTVLIVAQVAFAVALLPTAVFHAWASMRFGIADPGFAAEEFLTAQLVMDRGTTPNVLDDAYEREFTSRYADRHAELVRRLEAEPLVANVTFALDIPGEEATVWIEADGVPMPTEPADYAVGAGSSIGHQVRFSRVDLDFFDVFDVPVLTGRPFEAGDIGAGATAVIVNRSFVQQLLGNGNVLGRRIRYVGSSRDASPEHVELGRWYEIVGVVKDFPANAMEAGRADAKLYHAAGAGEVYPVSLAVRVKGTAPATFAGRLREISAAVDPNLQLRNIASMDEVLRKEQAMMRLVAAALAILTLSVVFLSAAGIYALMSFTVAQRRKEIGIRAALGADPTRILRSIFSRALGQLAIGAAVGGIAAAVLDGLTGGDLMEGNGTVVLPIVAALMTVVGLLAALGPARRGLRIHPTEALREQ